MLLGACWLGSPVSAGFANFLGSVFIGSFSDHHCSPVKHEPINLAVKVAHSAAHVSHHLSFPDLTMRRRGVEEEEGSLRSHGWLSRAWLAFFAPPAIVGTSLRKGGLANNFHIQWPSFIFNSFFTL